MKPRIEWLSGLDRVRDRQPELEPGREQTVPDLQISFYELHGLELMERAGQDSHRDSSQGSLKSLLRDPSFSYAGLPCL